MSAVTASTQSGEHPRPQLIRDEWLSLDGEWEFAIDDDDRGARERWWSDAGEGDAFDLRITVPFTLEAPLSGIADTAVHPVVWYRRTISIGERRGGRTILHFGAVDHTATVWVDGTLVTTHVGGQTAFEADITDALAAHRPDGEHVIVVRAEDRYDADTPRGKQDWRPQPHAIWYHRATGIWQSVWLEQVPELHIHDIAWQTNVPQSTVSATIRLNRMPPDGAEIGIALRLDGQAIASARVAAQARRIEITLEIPGLRNAQERERMLWSPGNPVLVDAQLTVAIDGESVDEASSYFGIRTTTVGRGAFLLNGRPEFVRAVLEQGYWEDGLWTAPSPEHFRAEVEAILELGFNTVRIHQKIEDSRFLYWCDRLGLMVWAEIGAAYGFSPDSVERFAGEWVESVRQRRSHPAVVVWVPFNESWGIGDVAVDAAQRDLARGITALTRALDATRPVISNDGWEHVDSDILSIHDYAQQPELIAQRYDERGGLADVLEGMGPTGHRIALDGQQLDSAGGRIPVILSEFGGIAFANDETWGYAVAADPDAFEQAVGGLIRAAGNASMLAGFCYTQLTDTRQEANGLLRADRSPKLPIERIRSMVLGDDGGHA